MASCNKKTCIINHRKKTWHNKIWKYAIVFASTQLRITWLRKNPIDPKAYLGRCMPYLSLQVWIQRGWQGARTRPGKSQVIRVSIGNMQLDPPPPPPPPPWKNLPPPLPPENVELSLEKKPKKLCQSFFCQTDLDPPDVIPGSAHAFLKKQQNLKLSSAANYGLRTRTNILTLW